MTRAHGFQKIILLDVERVREMLKKTFLGALFAILFMAGINFNVTSAVDYEGFEQPLSNGVFSAYDYFPVEPGHYVQYRISDGYNYLNNCTVEVVFQYPDSEGEFFATLTKIGTLGGFFCESAIFGREIDGKLAYNRGYPVGNQANFWFRLFTLPLTFKDGDSWRKGSAVYRVSWVGDVEVGSKTYQNCLKIQIDNADSINAYFRGEGEIYLSRGIGIIKYVFRRSNGKVFTAEILESGELPPRTISGRLTLDGVEPAEGYMVALAYRGREGVNADITDSPFRCSGTR